MVPLQKPHFQTQALAAMVFHCSFFMNRLDFVQNESLHAADLACRGDGRELACVASELPPFLWKNPL